MGVKGSVRPAPAPGAPPPPGGGGARSHATTRASTETVAARAHTSASQRVACTTGEGNDRKAIPHEEELVAFRVMIAKNVVPGSSRSRNDSAAEHRSQARLEPVP